MTVRPPEDLREEADDRVLGALREGWDTAPEVDRAALWSAIESRLGEQRVPWQVSFRRQLVGMFRAPMRLAALGAAAAVIAALLFLSGVFDDQSPASAAVVEQVTALSTTTRAAVTDGSLTSEEIAELRDRAVALLRDIDQDRTSLQQLTPEELRLVVDTLLLVGDDLDDFLEEDHGEFEDEFEEALESIRESESRASDLRRERGDEDDERDGGERDDDDRSSAPATSTPIATASSGAASAATSAATPTRSEATQEPGDDATSIPAARGTYTAQAGHAGSVTFSFDGERLELDSVAPAAGWAATIEEERGSELKVRFRAADQELTLEVERRDDQLQIQTKTASVDDSEYDD